MKIKKFNEREASDFRDAAALAYTSSPNSAGYTEGHVVVKAWQYAESLLAAREGDNESVSMPCSNCTKKQDGVSTVHTLPKREFEPYKPKSRLNIVLMSIFIGGSCIYAGYKLVEYLAIYFMY